MAANSIIEQKPPAQIWQILPVGQELIFVVSNQTAVANETRVKFVAEVHISDTSYPNLNTTTDSRAKGEKVEYIEPGAHLCKITGLKTSDQLEDYTGSPFIS